MPPPTRRPAAAAAGYTLVEVMTTIGIAGVLMAISVGGWTQYAQAKSQEGAAQEIQSVLRQAQQRAVTEGSSMCVQFDTAVDTFALYRRPCDDSARVLLEGPFDIDSRVHLAEADFTGASGSGAGVTFTPRGTASPGTLRITREGTDRVYVVSVEGLTGRVSTS
ncbi:prepilin-type N-terminal cleavage/methylation domain-containing protein [Nocardioides sp. MAH-18]|uniref:Prepilin-type N-terminal cleavage/methylation domain-containing protein n=1 Tax=Nocardioides agri TaxID=2682843 RepID=A0A6L6XQD8_9ACTN|nr:MULTISPECIES: GspH/FimT family pseudopilin [unclassified Nocardioides]MBA2954489.1 type II secretion system protein [Nocardioides sp. CGMCC 1.13656]MVQ49350.1 prepilin-type N-terminal cleavage/methylation domain-containing protein [Nocardioides sp. MAH-18]